VYRGHPKIRPLPKPLALPVGGRPSGAFRERALAAGGVERGRADGCAAWFAGAAFDFGFGGRAGVGGVSVVGGGADGAMVSVVGGDSTSSGAR
jgi:hypothetical protein